MRDKIRTLVLVCAITIFLFSCMQMMGQSNAMPVGMNTGKYDVNIRANSLRELCGYDHSGQELSFDMTLSNYFDIRVSAITDDPELKRQLVSELKLEIKNAGYKITEPKHKDPFEPDAYLLDAFVCFNRLGYIIPVSKIADNHKGTGTIIGDHPEKTVFHYDID